MCPLATDAGGVHYGATYPADQLIVCFELATNEYASVNPATSLAIARANIHASRPGPLVSPFQFPIRRVSAPG